MKDFHEAVLTLKVPSNLAEVYKKLLKMKIVVIL